MFVHQWSNGELINLKASKVVCVGRNYLDHINELQNQVPEEPVIFIKPSTALCGFTKTIDVTLAPEPIHYELELAVLIGEPMSKTSKENCWSKIKALGLGLDLTYRQLQQTLKDQGLPWERAKSFDDSAVVSPWLPIEQFAENESIHFELSINGQVKQYGDTQKMMTSISTLLSFITQSITLLPGDIVLTGTPKGVGQLAAGDVLSASIIQTELQCTARVI